MTSVEIPLTNFPLRLCGDITLAEDLADFLLPMLSPLIRMCLARDRMRGS